MLDSQKWVVIWGNARVENGVIEHVPVVVPPAPVPPSVAGGDASQQAPLPVSPPHTLLRSSVEFEQGDITWEVWLASPSDSCFLMLPADFTANPSLAGSTDSSSISGGDLEFACGVNCLGAPYGLAMLRNRQWEPAGGVGQGSQVPAERWLQMKLTAIGSNIEFFVDGVRVMTTRRVLKKGQIGLYLQSFGPTKVRALKLTREQPLCFAVMQFTKDFGDLYEEVIRPQCEQFGYKVVRADEFYTSGQILDDIRQSIQSASLIIADVTPDNANVYYELGYAHGIGKQTILLCDRGRERLPFDISGFRTVFYDNTIAGKRSVETRLRQFLEAIQER